MTLRIDVPLLLNEVSDYEREIFRGQYNRQQADSDISNANSKFESFTSYLNESKNELELLLTQSTLARTESKIELTRQVNQLSTAVAQRDSQTRLVQRNRNTLSESLSEIGSTTIGSLTHLTTSNARRELEDSQDRLSELRTSISRLQDRIDETKNDISDYDDVIALIKTEIAETQRQLLQLFLAIINVNNYRSTRDFFYINIDRARDPSKRVSTFAQDIDNTDSNNASLIEQNFISSITGMPPLASLIIQAASSQVNTFETSDNFVAGKPYAQFSMAWCADFVRWVLEDSGIDIDSHGRDALSGAYRTARAWSIYGAAGGGYGRYATAGDPKVGDLLIDRYNGTPTAGGHISIVVEVNVNGNPNLVRTVGGNEEDPNGNSPDAVRSQIKNLNESNRYLVTLAELNN